MPDIYVEHIEESFLEALDIYKPSIAILQGEYEGEEYTVEVRERELPEGTPPSEPVNINLISWDEAFYLEWEDDGGLVNSYDIIVEDSDGSIVSEVEEREESFLEYVDLPGSFPQNGEEYSFVITSNFFTENLTADPVVGEGSDRTPQNLTLDSVEGQDFTFKWDDLLEDFDHYRLYAEDLETQEVLKSFSTEVSEAVAKNLLPKLHNIWVVSVSEQSIFESDRSNNIELLAVQGPANFLLTEDNLTVTASWDIPEGEFEGYNLYLDSGDGFEKFNEDLITDTEYSFSLEDATNQILTGYVVAVDSDIEGDRSSESSVEIATLYVIVDEEGDVEFTDILGLDGIESSIVQESGITSVHAVEGLGVIEVNVSETGDVNILVEEDT